MSTNTRSSKIRRFGPLAPSYNGQRGGLGEAGLGSNEMEALSRDRSPALPHSVQVSLLQVGMRVRKSVMEGYRTGPKVFEQSLDYCLQSGYNPKSAKPHNDIQIYIDEDTDMADSEPSSSQESNSSTASSMPPPPPPPRKRTLEDLTGEERYGSAIFEDSSARKMEVAIGRTLSSQQQSRRKYAKPKTRKFQPSPASSFLPDTVEDFGEADFLVYDGNRG